MLQLEDTMPKKLSRQASPFDRVQKTVRISERTAFYLEVLSEQLNMSMADFLTELCHDVLPMFEDDRRPKVFRLLETYRNGRLNGTLRPVDQEEILKKLKILSRRA